MKPHLVLSGSANTRLGSAVAQQPGMERVPVAIRRFLSTDSWPQLEGSRLPEEVVPLAPLLADAIRAGAAGS